jgi:hypothetical protein
MGTLEAGVYQTNMFEPTLVFTLPDAWHELFTDDEDEVALEGPGAFVNMTRPTEVIEQGTGTVPAPEDMLEWLTSHPTLDTARPLAIEVAGIPSHYVDVGSPAREVALFHYPGGNMRIPSGAHTRWYVVPLDGPDLVVMVGDREPPSEAKFQAAVELVQPIVESLEVVP